LRECAYPTSCNHLIEEIEEARGDFDDMKLRSDQMITMIRLSGLAPQQSEVAARLPESGIVKFCQTHGLPLGKVEPLR
jgi:hypothetical protein